MNNNSDLKIIILVIIMIILGAVTSIAFMNTCQDDGHGFLYCAAQAS